MASVILGLVYNASSPLGVRNVGQTGTAGLTPITPGAPPATREVPGILPAMEAGAQTSAGQVYQNQTVALTFSGLTPNPATSPPIVNSPARTRPTIPTLTWAATKPLVEQRQAVLVDARVTPHFQAGHIPGAVSLPSTSTAAEKQAFLAQYPRDTPLIIYCGSSACSMGHDLAENLITQFGYTNVRVMPGGFAEYRQVETQSISP